MYENLKTYADTPSENNGVVAGDDLNLSWSSVKGILMKYRGT